MPVLILDLHVGPVLHSQWHLIIISCVHTVPLLVQWQFTFQFTSCVVSTCVLRDAGGRGEGEFACLREIMVR